MRSCHTMSYYKYLFLGLADKQSCDGASWPWLAKAKRAHLFPTGYLVISQ